MAEIKILMLCSKTIPSLTPAGCQREFAEVEGQLRQAKYRERFELHAAWDIEAKDIQSRISSLRPQILHFSGHGNDDGELVFGTADGRVLSFAPELFAKLLALNEDIVKCMVLNACYSKSQAELIARHIGHVIGMSHAVDVNAAVTFSAGFYRALADGEPFAKAVVCGTQRVRLAGLVLDEEPVHLQFEDADQTLLGVGRASGAEAVAASEVRRALKALLSLFRPIALYNDIGDLEHGPELQEQLPPPSIKADFVTATVELLMDTRALPLSWFDDKASDSIYYQRADEFEQVKQLWARWLELQK